MSERTHHRPGWDGCVRGLRTSPRLDWRPATAEQPELSMTRSLVRESLSEMGYHRCHGEARAVVAAHVEVGVGSFCMDNGPSPVGGEVARTGSSLSIDRVCASSDAHAVSSSQIARGQSCQELSRPPTASRVSPTNMGTSIRAPGVRYPASCQAQ